MELLLDHGSDVLLTDDQSYTSLHLSAAWESAPTVNLLLAAGSDINTLNRKTAADVVSQSVSQQKSTSYYCLSSTLATILLHFSIRKLLS